MRSAPRSRSATRSRTIAALLVAFALVAVPRLVEVAQTSQKTVLVLVAWQRGSTVSTEIDGTIRRVLSDGLAGRLDYYTEYLDVARFAEPDYQPAVRDFFRRKYANRTFDVVVATTDAMVAFVHTYRSELFPGAAVVSATVNPPPGPNATGVLLPLDLKSSIDVAIQLHPGLRQVLVVSGESAADRFYQDLARSQLRTFDGRLEFTYSSGLAMPELLRRAAELPPDTIVYFVTFFEDARGDKFEELQALERVAAVATVPTYAWLDTPEGSGTVGGSVLRLEIAADAVAHVALRVLKGESPDSIPVHETYANVTQFDWRQLRRWGISEARLPAGSVVRFRQPSLWDQYKFYIVGAISVLLLQTALLGRLAVQRARRRRVEAALRASNEQNQDLAGRLITAQEDERRRIARDLHDDVNQRLAVLSVEMELLGSNRSGGDAVARSARIAAQLRDLSADVHKLSHELHPAKVDQLGLVTAAAGYCRDLMLQSGLHIDFFDQNVPTVLAPNLSLGLYRIIQESLHNALRHGRASAARVELIGDGADLRLSITDDGVGFDVNEARRTGGLGLVSMQERVRLLQGTVVVHSSPGQGTRVEAAVPLLLPHGERPESHVDVQSRRLQ